MKLRALFVLSISLIAWLQPAHAVLNKLFDKDAESEAGKSEVILPEYKGIKHSLAVQDFDNPQSYRAQYEIGGALGMMLESALSESGRFVIVEREKLGTVITEQDLAVSGRVAESSQVAQAGLIRSAKYIATGTVTRVSQSTGGNDGGIGFGGIRVGGSNKEAELELVVKLIDTTSSTVVASKRILGKAGGQKLRVGYSSSGFRGDLGGFAETPLGEAAQDAISTAVTFIATEMEDYEITANIVMVKSADMIVLNRGENYGVQVGDEFLVREAGETLTDPETGEILDVFEGEVTGKVRVKRVTEKVSYAELVDGTPPARGDAVVFNTANI